MEYIKVLGRFGIVIGILVFIIVFIQNSFNSALIKDSVEYNLLYSYNIEEYDENNSILTVCFKNNGIKSLEDVRLNIQFNKEIKGDIELVDTVIYTLILSPNPVLKNYLVYYKGDIYPSEHKYLLLKFLNKNNSITNRDIRLMIGCKYCNGIPVKDAYISQEINYSNLRLYINGANKLLWLIFFRLIFPIFIILLILFALFKLIIKIPFVKKIILYLDIEELTNKYDKKQKNK